MLYYRYWLKLAKGRSALDGVYGGSRSGAYSCFLPMESGQCYPSGIDVWQYAQSMANQESSLELQCPEFLLELHHGADLSLQLHWKLTDTTWPKASNLNHTVDFSGMASPHPKTTWCGHLDRLSSDPRHSFLAWHFKDWDHLPEAEDIGHTSLWTRLNS